VNKGRMASSASSAIDSPTDVETSRTSPERGYAIPQAQNNRLPSGLVRESLPRAGVKSWHPAAATRIFARLDYS
jgi:hypothetical protein